jgi:hypothetical protein
MLTPAATPAARRSCQYVAPQMFQHKCGKRTRACSRTTLPGRSGAVLPANTSILCHTEQIRAAFLAGETAVVRIISARNQFRTGVIPGISRRDSCITLRQHYAGAALDKAEFRTIVGVTISSDKVNEGKQESEEWRDVDLCHSQPAG